MVRLNTGKSWSPAVFLINQCPTARPRIIVRHGRDSMRTGRWAGRSAVVVEYLRIQTAYAVCMHLNGVSKGVPRGGAVELQPLLI